MSKKGKHIDVLGETHLPDDLLTPSLSTGFGIGQFPDDDNGGGLRERDDPPGSSPSAEYKIVADEDDDIPSDIDNPFNDPCDDGLDFTAYLKEGGIQDLSWLEMSEQDADRLPKDTTETAIPELEDAWGVHRQTDGIHFFDNTDIDVARYEAQLKDDSAPKNLHTAADLARVVRKAMRRSAAGHSLPEILREAAEALGAEAHRIRGAMQLVKDEHGLAGNVFIRAAAYPGYEQGKWNETLRKLSNARYIIVDKETLRSATHIQGGHCSVTKKAAVLDVPWAKALAHYTPRLVATGRKVASGGDPRQTLRTAFLTLPERKAPDTALPQHQTPSERISRQAAWTKFHAMKSDREVYDPSTDIQARKRASAWTRINTWVEAGLVSLETAMGAVQAGTTGEAMLGVVAAHITKTKGASAFSGLPNDVRPVVASRQAAEAALQGVTLPEPLSATHHPLAAKRKQACLTLARWVKAGLISEADATRLAKSGAEPIDMLKAASALVTATKPVGNFSGVTNDVRVSAEASREQVWETLTKAAQRTKAAQSKVDAVAQERRANSTMAARKIEAVRVQVAKVTAAIGRGVRGQVLRDFILRTIPKDQVRLASKMLVPVLRETGALNDAGRTAKKYEGVSYRPVAQKVAEVLPHEREVTAMLRWVRRAMQEAFVGKDLDSLLSAKFSKAVRAQGADQLASLRQQHEGGAGFMYVDASAYASPVGVAGCEEGALKHRTNAVRYVMAMDRCGTCTLAQTKADGSRVCGKYAKQLVLPSEFPEGMSTMRQANIKAASMTDFETTASLFGGYSPSEFSLQNAALDDIEMDAAPEPEELSEVLFGGMEF